MKHTPLSNSDLSMGREHRRLPFGSMTDKSMLMTILALAWPTMLEQFMQTAVQYIDTAMVGTLGTQATAAVGSTATVNWLIGSTISAVGVGFLSYIAKAQGANQQKSARRAVSQAVLITVILGIFFTIVTTSLSGLVPVWMQVEPAIRAMSSKYFLILYLPMLPRAASIIFGTVLRSAGDTKSPMKIGVFVNLINVALNFLLIYPVREISFLSLDFTLWGAGLGVIGAAIASASAFTAGGICITFVLWRHPRISPRGERFLPDLQILRPCMRVALPNMLQRFGTHHCQYRGIRLLYSRLWDADGSRHPGGKRLRRQRLQADEKPGLHVYSPGNPSDDFLRRLSLFERACSDGNLFSQ